MVENENKEYRQQTEEDLKTPPMSAMQKAILAVAILGVVLAVAYVFFL